MKELNNRPTSGLLNWRSRSSPNSDNYPKPGLFKQFSCAFKKKHLVEESQFQNLKIGLTSDNFQDVANSKKILNALRSGEKVFTNTTTTEKAFKDLCHVTDESDRVKFVPRHRSQKLLRTRNQEEFIQTNIYDETCSSARIHRGYIYVCLDRMGTIEHLVSVSREEVSRNEAADEKKGSEDPFRSFRSCDRSMKRRHNTSANTTIKRWAMWKDNLTFVTITRRVIVWISFDKICIKSAVIDFDYFFLNLHV